MLSNILKIFKKSGAKSGADKNTIERRAADRTTLPDASAPGKKPAGSGEKKKENAPPTTDAIKLDLSAKERKAEEQKARSALKKKLKEQTEDTDDPFGFSISLPTVKHDDVHQTIAVSLPELGAACKELKKAMRVKDISTTGIGLRYEKPRIKAGTELTLILATKKAKLTTNLKATVRHHEQGILGACFHDLTRQQENLLAKLILEGQKRQRNKRKGA